MATPRTTPLPFVDKKVDVNALSEAAQDDENWPPLCYAAAQGHPATIAILLEANADVNVQALDYDCGFESCGHQHLMRPLHSAVGSTDAIKMLLEAKAEVNAACKDGCTALHHAAVSGRLEGMLLLIEANADVEAKDESGRTAQERSHGMRIRDYKGVLELFKTLAAAKATADAEKAGEFVKNVTTPLLEKMFEAIDAHKSGFMDKASFTDFFIKVGGEKPGSSSYEKEVEEGWQAFLKGDADGDGQISKEEFVNYVIAEQAFGPPGDESIAEVLNMMIGKLLECTPTV